MSLVFSWGVQLIKRRDRGDFMRKAVQKPLCALIALSLATAAAAQDEDTEKPTLYTTVDEHEIYLIIGDEQYDLKTGESAVVDGDELQFVGRPPAFLNWPCGTSAVAVKNRPKPMM